ncbi:hypothetical protein ELQ87_25670 [Streptomyces griseoviridis]|uniref:Endonuclease/exonuclease/phosphatase family protein n=1 Tax=Streptomyces griseoviridis TaxID=45398 RepID=A0A3Q9KVY9_STRGD|nr:hypothetical protein [Streptomyces griseoviridis]AZS87245.1 hypothetical protein ELQ87_25670 [Streptomyces griseoviridis]QCN85902.1 hypothetical protein DDJ31_13595 [Streptomyces griseoviridis]
MTGTDIRLLSWYLLNGGIDGADEECRRMKQLNFLSTLPQLDVLWLMETTGWEGQDDCRLADLHDATGLTPLGRVTSHVGDGYRALMFANGNRVQVETAGELERGAFHLGALRASVTIDGLPLLLLGARLSRSSGADRLREAHHLADYGQPSPPWPGNAILLMDTGTADDCDPEMTDREWEERVPRARQHHYRTVHPDGTLGGWDRGARRLLLNAGWRDPQSGLPQRTPSVGHWYANAAERLRLHADQAMVAGSGLHVTSYRTHDTPDLRRQSTHLPMSIDVRLAL